MSITHQQERFADFIQEARPLIERHFAEVDPFLVSTGVADEATYLGIEEAGLLRVYTARQDGRLAGYATFLVRASPHCADSIHAVHDTLYLDPASRKGLAGLRFLAWCEERLRAEGVDLVYQHVSVKHDHRRLLERRGYQLTEYVYARRLHPCPQSP